MLGPHGSACSRQQAGETERNAPHVRLQEFSPGEVDTLRRQEYGEGHYG